MTGAHSVRTLRLQALMARQLDNWREAWRAYASGAPMPVLRFRNGVVLHSGPGDSAGFLFLEVFANGCYRRGLPAAVRGEVVDIGANIGAFTIDIATRYPGTIVHAYEPNPPARERLQQNVEANGLSSRVRIWSEAVSGQSGIATLWRGDGTIAASAYLPTSRRGESCDVATVTLATVVGRTGGRVAVLKLDCEGAEAEILEAAGPALEALDYIVGEYHPDLVADVLPRLRRVLDPAFDVAVTDRGRCGTMIRARRQAASNPRVA
jgi:FkbM family methyltransferase